MNRNMEAKRIKYIRQSRAKPRTLRMNNGHQKVPQSVDRSKIPKQYLGLFAYRERAKTFIDEFIEAKFGIKRPIEDAPLAEDAFCITHPELPKDERFIMTKLLDGRFRSLAMFKNSRLTCIYFIEFLPTPGLIRKSVTYNDYDRALNVFHLDSIRWKEVINVPNVE